jgi:hypothetical protein
MDQGLVPSRATLTERVSLRKGLANNENVRIVSGNSDLFATVFTAFSANRADRCNNIGYPFRWARADLP